MVFDISRQPCAGCRIIARYKMHQFSKVGSLYCGQIYEKIKWLETLIGKFVLLPKKLTA